MEALKQAQIKDNYESFIELVADYEQIDTEYNPVGTKSMINSSELHTV